MPDARRSENRGIWELNITHDEKLKLLESTESVNDRNPERVSGYRGYLRFHELDVPGVIELRSIFVSPEDREKGYGTNFVKWLEKWCRDNGYREIYIHSKADSASVFGKFLVAIKYKYLVKDPIGGGWYKSLKINKKKHEEE